MKRNLFYGLLISILFLASQGWTAVIYENDFSSGVGSEWNTTKNGIDLNDEMFLGLFAAYYPDPKPDPWNGDLVTLTLPNVAAGTYSITFDLFTINTWDDCNSTCCGPDTISFKINNATIFDTWFDSGGNNGAGLTPSGDDILYFEDNKHNEVPNIRYTPTYTFSHSGGDLTFSFLGKPSQPDQQYDDTGFFDEPWALDNVKVESQPSPVPIPAAAWLLGTGLLGLFGMRKRMRQ